MNINAAPTIVPPPRNTFSFGDGCVYFPYLYLILYGILTWWVWIPITWESLTHHSQDSPNHSILSQNDASRKKTILEEPQMSHTRMELGSLSGHHTDHLIGNNKDDFSLASTPREDNGNDTLKDDVGLSSSTALSRPDELESPRSAMELTPLPDEIDSPRLDNIVVNVKIGEDGEIVPCLETERSEV